jgi:hypothetical protein
MMKMARPGILAVRAVNQYRRRDVFTYLGLRYYLDNSTARTDGWARYVATDLASTRSVLPYLNAHHFKEVNDDGTVRHRPLYMPGANEALAEAALLAECAKHPEVFGSPACVFSYFLTRGKDRRGVFEPYIEGLKGRHRAVAKAAASFPDGFVQHVDIKKFYPSISQEMAQTVWRQCCEKAELGKGFPELGEKLIADHGAVPRDGEMGVLTGPMFSHLLANLVLRDFDVALSDALPGRYFRYVDDIILVGDVAMVDEALATVESQLDDLGFKLHGADSEKRLRVSAAEWLSGEDDFSQQRTQVSWPALIGDLKRYLLTSSEKHGELQRRLSDGGFRLPLPNYSALAYEAGWLERLRQLARMPWVRRKTQGMSAESLLTHAHQLRMRRERDLRKFFDQVSDATPFLRKRLVSKMRLAAGQLVYLSDEETLKAMSIPLCEISELHLHGRVMEAVATRRLDKVLPLGTNAAQASAQALGADNQPAFVSLRSFNAAEHQALAVLMLNGVAIATDGGAIEDETELLRLARNGCDQGLMKSGDPFLRELACLHGLTGPARHSSMLNTAFDQDDDLVLDAIDKLQESASP